MTKFEDHVSDLETRGGAHEFQYEDCGNQASSEGLTPSQTIGPFFAYGLTPGAYGYQFEDIHSANLLPLGDHITPLSIEGQVFDGAGLPVHDAMIEIIQADGSGLYVQEPRNDGFTGYGRCGTGSDGPPAKGGKAMFQFTTIKPGPTQDGAAPFITLIITMRGLLNHCITRMYFPEDDHHADLILSQVPEPRRETLIATSIGESRYRFDIHIQGDQETVFFDL